MSDELRPDREREGPILPPSIDADFPRQTIERLATALYWIGRTAIRGQGEAPDVARARLALIEQAAQAALEPQEMWPPRP
jgi:hypothetical protein